MKKYLIILVCYSITLFSCSNANYVDSMQEQTTLSIAKQVTKNDVIKTNVYTYFTINTSPEDLASLINQSNSTIISAMYKNKPVFLKFVISNDGLKFYVKER